MAGGDRAVFRLYRSLWGILDLLYPPVCAGCQAPGAHWCLECQAKVQVIQPPLCERCGQPIDRGKLCPACRVTAPSFIAARSWACFHGPVRHAIHQLKYRRNISIGIVLVEALLECFYAQGWQVDLLAVVPLGVARLKERGYNQSDLIARPLGLAAGIKYSPQVLRRIRETRSQVGLTHAQRRDNVRGAFQAEPDRVAGRSLLVVDDVATSSATLDACAQACLEAGAARVYCLTLARACQSGLELPGHASESQGG